MKRIPLSRGMFAIVDDEDFDLLRKHSWHYTSQGYAKRCLKMSEPDAGKMLFMHRQIMGLRYGEKQSVDHINGNGLDNRRCNLRICTQSMNVQRGILRKSMHGYRGVKSAQGRYCVQIRFHGKYRYVGVYNTPKEAAYAYDLEVRKSLDGHAFLNFPPDFHMAFTPLEYIWRGQEVEMMPDSQKDGELRRIRLKTGEEKLVHFHSLRRPKLSGHTGSG